MNPDEALQKLLAGHTDFLAGASAPISTLDLVSDLAQHGQHPSTAVITCSDSRVAPEIVFQCRLGDLFTIRTAGNVVSDSELASLEYAVDHLHTSLILVLGHSGCGAVQCALQPHGHCSPCLQRLIERITPSATAALSCASSPDAVRSLAEDLNIDNSVREILRHPAFEQMTIYSAKYDIYSARILYLKATTKIGTEIVINGMAM